MEYKEKIAKLAQMIEESHSIVFFGGAGVSTESGIPDFRSKDGLYNQHDVQFEKYEPEYLLSKECLTKEPEVFFEFYRQKLDTRNINPNFAHIYLAELEEEGKLSAIVTQNIDGLHQKAGSKVVHEIHGTAQRIYCPVCQKEYPSDYIFTSSEKIPHCDVCGEILRPDITLYGEDLPYEAVTHSIAAISKADMLIVGGTSLNVYPAASYLSYFTGEHLVIINKSHLTLMLAENNDMEINESIGKVFTDLKKERNK